MLEKYYYFNTECQVGKPHKPFLLDRESVIQNIRSVFSVDMYSIELRSKQDKTCLLFFYKRASLVNVIDKLICKFSVFAIVCACLCVYVCNAVASIPNGGEIEFNNTLICPYDCKEVNNRIFQLLSLMHFRLFQAYIQKDTNVPYSCISYVT